MTRAIRPTTCRTVNPEAIAALQSSPLVVALVARLLEVADAADAAVTPPVDTEVAA